MSVLATYREPFGFAPRVSRMPEGLSLMQMQARVRGLPADFAQHGVICINGHSVPRGVWPLVRPKPEAHGVPVEVSFHAPVMGGDQGGGKQVFALVASIALAWAGGAAIAGKFAIGKLFLAESISSYFLAAGVSLVGGLLMSALVPPPTVDNGRKISNLGAASADGNALEPNGAIPRVIGTRKVFPPLVAEPLVYFDGPDEVVEAAYALAGPHQIADIRIGGVPIDEMTNLEYDTREGWVGDERLDLLTRQSRTDAVQTELRGHAVNDSDGRTLESVTGDTGSALPQALHLATREAPDEQWLHLVFPAGLAKNASESALYRVPFRLRLRPAGGTWIDLPELHFQAANVRQMRATIKLIWADDASTTPGAASSEGWVEARVVSPGQTANPPTDAWAADAYFDAGGDDYMDQNNLGLTGVDHVILDRYTAAIYLDTALYPKPGRYEVEITRGAVFAGANYSATAYTVSGAVWDFWGYQGTPGQIVQSRDGITDTVVVARSVSIWNEHPVPTDDFALIAVRARNRRVEAVSCLASGWVKDWDGADWTTWAVTSNPAPHFRDVMAGALNADALPASAVDEAGLVAWRTACTVSGYHCNALIEGQTVDDVLRIVAACGYARPYMSEVWGVARDYDRSAEDPVQIFTPRNSSGFRWSRAFPRLPNGFRVNFRDADLDYEPRQITVLRDGAPTDSNLVEQVTYEGIVSSAAAIHRAQYDLNQPVYRGTFYNLDAPAEAIMVRRGSLVGVNHEMLTAQHGAARVVDVEFSGGDISALILDDEVPVLNSPGFDVITDMSAVEDMSLIGALSGVAIRRAGSVTVHAVANAAGSTDRIEFAPAISATGLAEDALVTIGPLGRELLRLIVFAVTPRENFGASLTLVDEGQELWA